MDLGLDIPVKLMSTEELNAETDRLIAIWKHEKVLEREWNSGWDAGDEHGYRNGYDDGYKNGYKNGYGDCAEGCCEAT